MYGLDIDSLIETEIDTEKCLSCEEKTAISKIGLS